MQLPSKSLGRSFVLARGVPIIVAIILLVAPTPLHAQASAGQVYKSQINTVNRGIGGNAAKGTAEFRITGDELLITVNAEGLSPDMMHLMHVHGFADGKKAACATMRADTHKDGIVDVIEAMSVNGPEIIPLNKNPQDINIKSPTYPKSSKQGTLQYSTKIPLKGLQQNMQKKFGLAALNLENMVINIHGVDKKAKLPASVKSEMKLPAYQTVPVACGQIKRAQP